MRKNKNSKWRDSLIWRMWKVLVQGQPERIDVILQRNMDETQGGK